MVKKRMLVEGVRKSYRGFEIDYGVEKLSPFEESSLEDHEFGKLYFSSFRNELKTFREDTNISYAQMAEKYGDISAELKRFRTTIERVLTKFLKEYSKENNTEIDAYFLASV